MRLFLIVLVVSCLHSSISFGEETLASLISGNLPTFRSFLEAEGKASPTVAVVTTQFPKTSGEWSTGLNFYGDRGTTEPTEASNEPASDAKDQLKEKTRERHLTSTRVVTSDSSHLTTRRVSSKPLTSRHDLRSFKPERSTTLNGVKHYRETGSTPVSSWPDLPSASFRQGFRGSSEMRSVWKGFEVNFPTNHWNVKASTLTERQTSFFAPPQLPNCDDQ